MMSAKKEDESRVKDGVDAPLVPTLTSISDALGPGSNVEPAFNGAASEAAPTKFAERVVRHWKKGMVEILACAVAVRDGFEALKGDPEGLREFVNALKQGGVLTARDALDPEGSAKLSCLRKIAENVTIVGDPRVLAAVGPSPSKLALCARIAEKIPGDEEDKREGLVSRLERCPNEIVDRPYLLAEHKLLQQGDTVPPAEENDSETDSDQETDVSRSTWQSLRGSKAKFGRVLITPRERDLKVLTKSLAEPEKAAKALPLGELLSRDVAVIIAVPSRYFGVVVDRWVKKWGLRGNVHMLLAREPKKPDIGDEQVLVVIDRGEVKKAHVGDALWGDNTDDLDIAALARRLYPGGNWLHVFAEDAGGDDDTTALVGEDGWADSPGDVK